MKYFERRGKVVVQSEDWMDLVMLAIECEGLVKPRASTMAAFWVADVSRMSVTSVEDLIDEVGYRACPVDRSDADEFEEDDLYCAASSMWMSPHRFQYTVRGLERALRQALRAGPKSLEELAWMYAVDAGYEVVVR